MGIAMGREADAVRADKGNALNPPDAPALQRTHAADYAKLIRPTRATRSVKPLIEVDHNLVSRRLPQRLGTEFVR